MSDAFRNAYQFASENNALQRRNMLARQAGRMMAEGDTMGARNALYSGGELEAAGQLDTRIAADRKAKAEARARFATGIGRMLEMPEYAGNPEKVWNDALPIAEKLGLDLPGLAADRQTYISNPKAWAAFNVEEAKRELVRGENGQLDVWDGNKLSPLRAGRPEPKMYGDFLYVPDGQTAGTPGFNPNAPDPRRSAGGFDAVIDPLLQREGGYVARDGRSGAPANFGINQKYNPDVDVRSLTPEKAKELYKSRYWNAIGGDQLPPEAQAAVFDAAVNQGPQRALQWWQQSGGDLQKFNQLRLQHYRTRPDYAQNGRSWEARVAETGGGQPMQGGEGGDDLSGAPQIPGYRVLGRAKGDGAKDKGRPATAAEKAQFGIPANVPAQIKPDGTVDVIALPKGAEPPSPQAKSERAAKANSVISTVDKALRNTGGWTAGFVGGNLSEIKGTPAYDLARQVETIKANLGFEELQRMREASPTGGALGQVAVQELVALQATVANLDTGQSPEQLKANLLQIRKHYTNWLKAAGYAATAPPAAKPKASAPTAKPSDGWGEVKVN